MSLIEAVRRELEVWSTPGWTSADVESAYGEIVSWMTPHVAVCEPPKEWASIALEFSNPPPDRPLGLRVGLREPQVCSGAKVLSAFGEIFRVVPDMDAWGRPPYYLFRTEARRHRIVLLLNAAIIESDWLVSAFIVRWSPSVES